MEGKHLDARGKGEYTYDYRNDILLFKIKNREYVMSIDYENLVVDIDKEGYITGLRIFDASQLFGLERVALKDVKSFEFNTQVETKTGTKENKIITIQLRFIPMFRNKPMIRQGQDIQREAFSSQIKNSEVRCTVA